MPIVDQINRDLTRAIEAREVERLSALRMRKTHNPPLEIICKILRLRPVLTLLWQELKITPSQVKQIANHIAEFSIAYVHSARRTATTCAR